MALRPLLVVALFVLAGCGGLAGNSSSAGDVTVTPAPVPTDSPTPRPERAEPPPPLTGAVPNATALARLHADSLDQRSYRLRTHVIRSREGGEGSSSRSTIDRLTYRVQSGETYRAVRVGIIAGAGTTERLHRWEAYGDGEAEYRQVVDGDDTVYERRPLDPTTLPPHQRWTVAILTRYLDVADARVESVPTERGPRVRVVGRDPRAPELADVSDYRVEAVLTEAGRVEQFEASYRVANGTSVSVGFLIEDVGSVRIDQPTWYGEAQETALASGSGDRGGSPNGTTTPTPTRETSRPHPAGQ